MTEAWKPILPAHSKLGEPRLSFHPDLQSHRHVHPLRGLLEFGPYSKATIASVLDPIRVALVAPAGGVKELRGLLAELNGRIQPKERKTYLPDFPGVKRLLGVRVVVSESAIVELPASVDGEVQRGSQPHLKLAEHLAGALAALRRQQESFDVALIYLPLRWEAAFTGGRDDDFDLHHFIKATAAAAGIPTQVVNSGETSALGYFCRCSVAWRLSIALYTKAGGIPWKMSDTPPNTAFIGISYALKTTSRGTDFVTCCSQVFDAEGAGLEFIAYETDDVRVVKKNPHLSRSEMRRVMARSVALYQRRHAGRLPTKVVVHKTTPFRDEETDGCFDAWSSVDQLDLLQIQDDSPWRAIDLEDKRQPAKYPCDRGIIQPLGDRDVLLWTQGNVQEAAANGRDYFKEGKGIPAPLLVRRFAGHGGWDETARALLGLTKMNWNNDGLYDRLPVTLAFASTLANIVKRMPRIEPRAYQVRFFM